MDNTRTERVDRTPAIFAKILDYLVGRYNNPEIRAKVPTCLIHPHEYSYTIGSFYNKLRGFDPSTEWRNVYYFYPNKDSVYNTDKNVLVGKEKDMLYTVRLDHRLGYMAVLSMRKILMLDFDIKDYEVSSKDELKIKALELFKNLNDFLRQGGEEPLVWYGSETDKGFHYFLINKFIDYQEQNYIYQRLLTLVCGDMDYAAFSIFNGFCVRLSKKMNRENDYVATHKELKVPSLSSDTVFDTNSLIYDSVDDLRTVKDDILKVLNVKYRLIKYFIQFTTKHFEYLLYNYNKIDLATNIRTHIDLAIGASDELFNQMKNVSGVFEKTPSNIINFIKKTDRADTANFEIVDRIVRPNLYEKEPSSRVGLIEELDGGYKKKYLKYKQKYIEYKKKYLNQ
jgi:hypothetical protein